MRANTAASIGAAMLTLNGEASAPVDLEIPSHMAASAVPRIDTRKETVSWADTNREVSQNFIDEWSKVEEKEFQRLVELEVEGSMTMDEHAKFVNMSRLRDFFLNPVSFEQLTRDLEYRKRVAAAIVALDALTACHEGKD